MILRNLHIYERSGKRKRPEDLKERHNAFVYFLKAGSTNLYKIGWSKNPESRRASFQTPSSVLEIIHVIPSNWAPWLETYFHHLFATKSVEGEWFELDRLDLIFICSIEGVYYDLDKYFEFTPVLTREEINLQWANRVKK